MSDNADRMTVQATERLSKDTREKLRAWVRALRSGDYRQARMQLRVPIFTDWHLSHYGYCCLGVLCEISGEDYNGGFTQVPRRVSDWLGLQLTELASHHSRDESVQSLLIRLNDGDRATFDEIADYIEWRFDLNTDEESNNDSRATFEQIADMIDGLRDE